MRANASLICGLAVSLGACGDDGTPGGSPDGPPTTEPVDLATCDGNCAVINARAGNEAIELAFDRAFYGITRTASGDTLYVELSRGGDGSCPSKTSATPAQLLVVSGLPVFTSRTALSQADGITSNIFDFTGELTKSLAPSGHLTITLTPSAISLANPRFVAFDFTATYENNLRGSGHVYATHCDSLDTTE